MELMQASRQWATRPSDERFTSLSEMLAHFERVRANSKELTLANRELEFVAEEDHKGLTVWRPRSASPAKAVPTHWAFGQLCQHAEAPAPWLRTMPSEFVANALNYCLAFKQDIKDQGILLTKNGEVSLRAFTGPKYGRVWNRDVTEAVIRAYGDGTGADGSPWSVPGHFGKALSEITKENTTLYAGDQDMWIFLADEKNKIEVPGRRNGQPGLLSRGFFVWNSEVGDCSLGLATFLFDYTCCNRIVWGAEGFRQLTIRHTAGAPMRWVDEVRPALERLRQAPAHNIVQAIERAKLARLDNVDEWLAKRFGKRAPAALQDVSLDEEGHPIETMWDAVCAVTAWAKGKANQDQRVALERQAGAMLREVA